MTVQIRSLQQGDLSQMRQMIALFDEVFEEERTGDAPDAFLTDLLASSAFVAIVATEGANPERVIGAVTLHLLPNYRTGKNDGYIYDVGVAESHRRRGIATELMRALAAHARSLDLGDLWVQADAEDTWAVAFYESLGLAAGEVKHFEFTPEELSKAS